MVWISNLFKKKKSPLLAVDLCHDGLKALVLDQTAKGLVLQGFINEINEGLSFDNDLQDWHLAAKMLEKALKRAAIEVKDVALAICAKDVVTQTLEVSKSQDPSQLFSTVSQYLKKHFPYAQEMNFDFQVHPSTKQEMDDVLIVACKKHKIERLKTFIAMANLNLVIVDVKTYAFERAYRYLVENNLVSEKRVALIECDGLNLHIQILCMGKTEYVRDHQQSDNISSAIELNKQIIRALHHYHSSTQNSALDRIYLMNSSSLPHDEQILEESLEIVVERLDPLKAIPIALAAKTVYQREGANWMTCLGLALRGCQNDHTY